VRIADLQVVNGTGIMGSGLRRTGTETSETLHKWQCLDRS